MSRGTLMRDVMAWVLLAAVGLATGVSAAPVPPPAQPAAVPPGYFRVEDRDGTWWLIDPAGSPTLSIGVNNVTYEGDRIRGIGRSPYLDAAEKAYADRRAWGRTALQRLHDWGFNTLGAWSDEDLQHHNAPYTVVLDFAARAGADWLHGTPVDVYDRSFVQIARAIAQREAAPRAQDRMLVGYFSDNELWWGPDWRRQDTMLGMYLALSPDAPGRRHAIDFLRERYGGDIRQLNRAWGVRAADFSRVPRGARTHAYQADADAFLEIIATRYFTVSAAAIRAADPHHLYLGARFAGVPPAPVLRAARAVDIVSVNLYDRDPRRAIRYIFAISGRPVLISEFSFRALDSGLPNTMGAGPWVFNERTRAMAYASYVARLESLPEAIGYHWFRWADEPKEGRSDGENSNYGLVDLQDAPYLAFVKVVTETNRAAVGVHQGVNSGMSLRADSAWYRWSLRDILAVLLGWPRWLEAAVRAMHAFLERKFQFAVSWQSMRAAVPF